MDVENDNGDVCVSLRACVHACVCVSVYACVCVFGSPYWVRVLYGNATHAVLRLPVVTN